MQRALSDIVSNIDKIFDTSKIFLRIVFQVVKQLVDNQLVTISTGFVKSCFAQLEWKEKIIFFFIVLKTETQSFYSLENITLEYIGLHCLALKVLLHSIKDIEVH